MGVASRGCHLARFNGNCNANLLASPAGIFARSLFLARQSIDGPCLTLDNPLRGREANLSRLSSSMHGPVVALLPRVPACRKTKYIYRRPVMATMTAAPARTDASIRESVASELKWDPRITSPDIAVAVKDGVVTLSGYVTSYWEKDAAEKAAKRVFGVKGVANDIEVKLASTRTDPRIARDAVHEIQSHISLPSDKIKVTVKGGWVTLEGTVEWQYQKALAESAVKKLKGVIGVINDIDLKPRVSPTEIKGKIEEALKRSAEAGCPPHYRERR